MKPTSLASSMAVFLLAQATPLPLSAADPVDFNREIKIILESTCLSCHGPEKPKGDLQLQTRQAALKGGDSGPALVPGKPDQSPLYTTTILPQDHDDVMPPKGDPLTPAQSELLKQWILQGAPWPEQPALKQVPRITFSKDIQPLLEVHCVGCHREGHDDGGLRLDSLQSALKGGDNGPALAPGQPEKSPLYTTTILPADDDNLMPPAKKGGPLPKEKTDLLKHWILQGAYWPSNVVLTPRKEELAGGADETNIVALIHQRILATQPTVGEASMAAYTNRIAGSMVDYAMVPIPAGQYLMGSPDTETHRNPDEGPQHPVKIAPFWMGRCEVTWNEFELFMYPSEERKIREYLGYQPEPGSPADAVTRPTAPYVEMSFGMGKEGYPAISMTQHAANKYCQWLSAKTGHFYRLPTEAEWEYACRAGTTTAYSFGNDPAELGDHAWYSKNSNWKYQKVGTKKPNPWGLHDMHGNVTEWCLDQYDPQYYQGFLETLAQGPWNKATRPYPHVARGGSWDDDAPALRSAKRRASDPSWKIQDPQLPKSIWYHTDAQFLGFRILRPLAVPTADALFHFWNSGVEREQP